MCDWGARRGTHVKGPEQQQLGLHTKINGRKIEISVQ